MTDAMVGTDASGAVDGELVGAKQPPAGEWLAPAAAASRLGVSERTLWRMVKAGRHHKRTERGRAEVLVPLLTPLPDDRANAGDAPASTRDLAAVSGNASGMADTVVLAVIDELRRQREDDAEHLTSQAETIGRLTAELDALRAQNAALLASGAAQPAHPSPEPPQPAEPFSFPAPLPPALNAAPWWRRWLAAVYG